VPVSRIGETDLGQITCREAEELVGRVVREFHTRGTFDLVDDSPPSVPRTYLEEHDKMATLHC
jgi:hypothetical protein